MNRIVLHESTVLDTWTNLEWQRCALGQDYQEGSCIGNGERVTWSDAQSVCTGDWRLPGVIELSSIVNPCGVTPSAYSEAFPNTPPTDFWSDTLFPDDDEKNWTVYFTTGWVEPTLHTGFARVRCVR